VEDTLTVLLRSFFKKDCFGVKRKHHHSRISILDGPSMQHILIKCSAVGYTLSMAIGGIFFAKQIRATGATTMIDPLKEKL
jgi:hypothetical protein